MYTEQQKAWEHLTDLEKSTLTLVIVDDKTKQEAAVILNIYPYKFTEIYNRGRRFFILFTDYYEKHNNLIPPALIRNEEALFFQELLKTRKRPSGVVRNNPSLKNWAIPANRNLLVAQSVRALQMSTDEHDGDFLNLLVEFDQWNNFRVLPKQYQMVSPFPRRRNREFKKIHQNLLAISDFGWETLESRKRTTSPPIAYMPNLSKDLKPTPVSLSRNNLVYFTNNKIPLFDSDKAAAEFAEKSYDFDNLERVNAHRAQRFWADFRISISQALNYNDLLNIKPGEDRDLCHTDKKFLKNEGYNAKKQLPKSRTQDSQFW